MKTRFVSIIWSHHTHMYGFAPEENYHLHALKIAKGLGYAPYAVIKHSKKILTEDPNFDPDICVIEYKNALHFFLQVIRLSVLNSIFYVNSYEWQSFVLPFLARRTIFMAHTQPKRQTEKKQRVQNFVYKFFKSIRLNNEEERQFLLQQGTAASKLHVVPLVVSQDVFRILPGQDAGSESRSDIVYFGNITAKKNLPTIIKAFEIAKASKPDLKLHVIGQMQDPTVIEMIDASPARTDIIQHGYLPNEQLVAELNKRLIYVNSSFDEGQCVAVYDAALAGCALCLPSIMSFVGVYKDSALFHDVTDSKTLAKNILYYISNPIVARGHNRINLEMIKKDYSTETVERKMKELFTNI